MHIPSESDLIVYHGNYYEPEPTNSKEILRQKLAIAQTALGDQHVVQAKIRGTPDKPYLTEEFMRPQLNQVDNQDTKNKTELKKSIAHFFVHCVMDIFHLSMDQIFVNPPVSLRQTHLVKPIRETSKHHLADGEHRYLLKKRLQNFLHIMMHYLLQESIRQTGRQQFEI